MFAIILLQQGKGQVYKSNDCKVNIINPENMYLFNARIETPEKVLKYVQS